jgi:hypothetical protein
MRADDSPSLLSDNLEHPIERHRRIDDERGFGQSPKLGNTALFPPNRPLRLLIEQGIIDR